MKRLKYAFAGLISLFAINVWAGLVVSTVSKNAIITPAVPATYKYDANASFGITTGTYWAEWNNMKFICKSQGVPALKEWISNTNGYYNEWYFPDGWFTNLTWSAQIQSDLRYDVFYGHPPGEVNQFRCQNITEGGTNSAYRWKQIGGTTYYCTGIVVPNFNHVFLPDTCNGTTCKSYYKFANRNVDYCGAIKPPVPKPVIVNNPCPKYQSNSSGGVRNADSTFIKADNLCVDQVKVGFDSEGNAKSVLIEQYNQVASTVASTGLGAILRSGGADSTSIGGGLPNTVNYSDFTLGKNANGQTQLQGASTGTATVR